jgi:opacity protein-like surface antigen
VLIVKDRLNLLIGGHSMRPYLCLLLVAAGASVGCVSAGSYGVRHLTLLVGERNLSDNVAEQLDLDDQTVFGLELDEFDAATGAGWEAGLAFSDESQDFSGVDVELKMSELFGGYRHTFLLQETFHPYAGVGVAFVKGEGDEDFFGSSDDDSSLGAYLRLGMAWDVSGQARLGLEYRRLFLTDVEIGGFDGDLDNDQIALTLGFPF